MQQTVWQNFFIRTQLLKLKTKAFFVFVWHELLMWSRCYAIYSKPSV